MKLFFIGLLAVASLSAYAQDQTLEEFKDVNCQRIEKQTNNLKQELFFQRCDHQSGQIQLVCTKRGNRSLAWIASSNKQVGLLKVIFVENEECNILMRDIIPNGGTRTGDKQLDIKLQVYVDDMGITRGDLLN